MEVNCEGCAGCCIDWRELAPDADLAHERRGRYRPVDDAYNLVVLTRDDVRTFLDAGLGDAMTPRLFYAETGVDVDGTTLAAIDGRPVFFVGLRKPPKPVGPFDSEATWLPACVFLDPTTLQCRVHDTDRYPQDCAEYPGHDLALDHEPECERVEREFGGERLVEATPPEDLPGLLLGPQAVGQKVFLAPDSVDLAGVVDRLERDDLTAADRAQFVAAAAASAPGTTGVNEARYEDAYERALAADSWVGRAAADWTERAASEDPDPTAAEAVEEERGAPPTPGWD